MNDTKVVLFDLDGTLLDTGRDMGAALNRLLADHDRPALPYAVIRSQVSHGANALVQLGFGLPVEDPQFEQLRVEYLRHYEQGLCVHSGLFDGMDDVLAHLEARRLPWGIVTNKPAYLTEPLLDQLGLLPRAACVVSGDTLKTRKPCPEPLLYGCRLAGGEPASCVYVGDAERDIQAGRDAGMKTLVATFGYLASIDQPEDWGADGMIDHPEDILRWIHPG